MSKAPSRFRKISAFLALFLLLSPALAAGLGARLSPLAPPPDWTRLEPYQKTLTRAEFVDRLESLYATTPESRAEFGRYLTLDDDQAVFFADEGRLTPCFRLFFAPSDAARRPLPPHPFHKPPIVCLDPGHIGGEWAHMEERYMQMGNDAPILEAKLNILACQRAAAILEKAGVRVVWAKTGEEPVTPLRPADLRGAARQALFESGDPLSPLPEALLERRVQVEAEKLFYRTAEIEARAHRVAAFHPDLTLCVHFNAAAWGNPLQPDFVPKSRLVVFVHGQYEADELRWEDERYDLVRKLLEHASPAEEQVAETIAADLQKVWPDYPPENYKDWDAVRRVGPNPCVYARNLLANRLYPGPVVFVEGPYMNAKDAYPRLQAGDYDGIREIDGQPQRSIFAEYGQALADGALRYLNKK